MQQEEKINLFDYEYSPNQTVEIPANNLLNILYFCKKVIDSQVTLGIPYVYPNDVSLKRDKDGGLESVEVDWKAFSELDRKAFFNSMDSVVPFATEVSVLAEQVSYAYGRLHQENIDKGFAKKRVDLTKEEEEAKVAKTLSK